MVATYSYNITFVEGYFVKLLIKGVREHLISKYIRVCNDLECVIFTTEISTDLIYTLRFE